MDLTASSNYAPPQELPASPLSYRGGKQSAEMATPAVSHGGPERGSVGEEGLSSSLGSRDFSMLNRQTGGREPHAEAEKAPRAVVAAGRVDSPPGPKDGDCRAFPGRRGSDYAKLMNYTSQKPPGEGTLRVRSPMTSGWSPEIHFPEGPETEEGNFLSRREKKSRNSRSLGL